MTEESSMASPPALAVVDNGHATLLASGDWTLAHVTNLEALCRREFSIGVATVDISQVSALDTVGAWLFEKLLRRISSGSAKVAVTGISESQAGLLRDMHDLNRTPMPVRPRDNPILSFVERVGRGTVAESAGFLQMLGAVAIASFGVLRCPRSLRLTPTIYQLYKVGWLATPIMALITLLIGAIIAQQGFFHFRKFGAESYTVDMVGILVLREIGVLIVAIMVAGRSGSAYTAELGSMKMREEIDALSTMGLDPIAVLILPRVAALVIALPILTFIGSMAGLYGGGLVAQFYGDMTPAIYIARLHEAVSVTSFKVGILKAPFMALVIGIVACSEGLQVRGSAESLGKQTTTSVVKSIFLVIVLDGLFAVFFASIGM
jgi:phospholipid/cholesterol/gamma-HCH transport system permease protein